MRLQTHLLTAFILLSMAATSYGEQALPPDEADQETVKRSPRPFLPWREKWRLFKYGEVKDLAGNHYNIRILPGFAKPMNRFKASFGKAGDAFECGWENFNDNTDDLREWTDDCLSFAYEGSGKAWKKNFGNAKRRMDKGSFGWWMAYPWATMRSSVETAFRVPVGTACAGVSTCLMAPSAGWHGTTSTLHAGYEVVIVGTVLPFSAMAWQTVATPPLALLEKTPSPESVDKRWVEIIHAADESDKSHPLKESLDVIREIE